MPLDHLKGHEAQLPIKGHRSGFGVHDNPEAAEFAGHLKGKSQDEAKHLHAKTPTLVRLVHRQAGQPQNR